MTIREYKRRRKLPPQPKSDRDKNPNCLKPIVNKVNANVLQSSSKINKVCGNACGTYSGTIMYNYVQSNDGEWIYLKCKAVEVRGDRHTSSFNKKMLKDYF